jgi:hypothetical protein
LLQGTHVVTARTAPCRSSSSSSSSSASRVRLPLAKQARIGIGGLSKPTHLAAVVPWIETQLGSILRRGHPLVMTIGGSRLTTDTQAATAASHSSASIHWSPSRDNCVRRSRPRLCHSLPGLGNVIFFSRQQSVESASWEYTRWSITAEDSTPLIYLDVRACC